MIDQYAAVLVIIVIMILVNTINVIAQSQNLTNETGISGRISGFGRDLDFGHRVVDEPLK